MNVLQKSLAAFLLALVGTAACADTYPTRPVRWIVPYGPGGSTDVVTRIVAQGFSERIGQPVVVENKPGAGTLLATEELARARPDGHSIMTMGGSVLTIHPTLRKDLRFNTEKDFDLVRGLMKVTQILVVRSDLGIKTVQDLTAYLKRKDGEASYFTVGVGTPNHLMTEKYLELTGTKATHVPFNGTVAGLNEVIAKRIDFAITDLPTSAEFVKKGMMHAVAVPDEKRHRAYPNLPTFTEAGVPLVGTAWFGIALPAGTPTTVRQRIERDVSTVLQDPAIVSRIQAVGAEVLEITSSDALRAFAQDEKNKWAAVIRSRKITID